MSFLDAPTPPHHVHLQAISCHYASSHCEYIDVYGTMQDPVAREIEEVARRKTRGQEISFVVGLLCPYL